MFITLRGLVDANAFGLSRLGFCGQFP